MEFLFHLATALPISTKISLRVDPGRECAVFLLPSSILNARIEQV